MKYTKEDLYPGFKFIDDDRHIIQTIKEITNGTIHEIRCRETKQGTTHYTLSYLLAFLNTGKFKILTPKIKKIYEIY